MSDPSTPPVEPPRSASWPFSKRLCLRFALLYFLLYSHPFPLQHVPRPDTIAGIFKQEWPYKEQTAPFYDALGRYQARAERAERRAVDSVAQSIFGLEETLDRPLGSGDPTYSYVHLMLLLALALAGTLIWSLAAIWLDRRGRCERFAAPWLHLLARYWLAFALLGYGFAKVYPGQFRPPSLGRLVSVYGDSSPMNVLWTFMGSSPAYTVFAGVMELVGGLLLLFRRTATLGAVAGAAVMLNVVAMNFCYDVPVKVYSLHLLAVAVLLALPDLGRLWRVFVSNRTVAPRDLSRPWTPYFGHLVRLLVVGPFLYFAVDNAVQRYRTPGVPAPLYGIWDVVSHTEDGAALAPLTTDPRRWNALLVENETMGQLQAMDGSLRSLGLAYDEAAGTLKLDASTTWTYAVDADALTLRAEFARWFRPDTDPAAAGPNAPTLAPGDPRDPQVELTLTRAPAEAAALVADSTAGEEDVAATASEAAGDAPTSPETDVATPSPPEAVVAPPPSVPAPLVGRWRVSRAAVIGVVATRRRADPTAFDALTIGADGSVLVEHPGGATARYALAADAERGRLTLSSSDTLRATRSGEAELELAGTFRGHEVELRLARRDLRSFLLLRRGFHWINEVPLNRY